MRQLVLGLDIGGANIKAATSAGNALQLPFALWKQPERLPDALRKLLRAFPHARSLAVTMTGELCDCFPTKHEGVVYILEAVKAVSTRIPVRVWNTGGSFLNLPRAKRSAHEVAAANWHALATYASRLLPKKGLALLLDIGSTTTDLVPFNNRRIVSRGKTDPERLAEHELVYTGVRRTPLCALLGRGYAAEVFATTLDVYLLLNHVAEDPLDQDTADGRPATKAFAHGRLARMVCGDAETLSLDSVQRIAQKAQGYQLLAIHKAYKRVLRKLPASPTTIVLSGSGEFLGRIVLDALAFQGRRISLSDHLGPVVSSCACAFAVALLAMEEQR